MQTGIERLNKIFENECKILSIFLTAGYPELNSAENLLSVLEEEGVQLVEFGIPFSDPIADGPTIQETSERAIQNGMNISLMFSQVRAFRNSSEMPIVMMGYLNPVFQYGIQAFLEGCKENGVDGLIIPDLPIEEYQESWQPIMHELGLSFIFLITPQTSEARIRAIAELSSSFIYAVSSKAVTGGLVSDTDEQKNSSRLLYFNYLQDLNLRPPILVGFGINKKADVEEVNRYVSGAIIGSAFLRAISSGDPIVTARQFVRELKTGLPEGQALGQ